MLVQIRMPYYTGYSARGANFLSKFLLQSCMLSTDFIMLNMMKSVGCAGLVLFKQVLSWYLVYAFIILLTYPLLVIVVLGAYLTSFILLTACKHSTPSPPMSYSMQKVSTAKCSHHFPDRDSINLQWSYISSGVCCGRKMAHVI